MRVPVLLAVLALLAACAPPPATSDTAPTVFVLVRHAEKEGGQDPGLTAAGQARADALADVLAAADVDLIVGSQFRRTTDTVAPLADRLGLAVETRALDLADSPRSAAEIARPPPPPPPSSRSRTAAGRS